MTYLNLDVNYTNRVLPVRVLPGYSKPDIYWQFGLSKNHTFLSRRLRDSGVRFSEPFGTEERAACPASSRSA